MYYLKIDESVPDRSIIVLVLVLVVIKISKY